MENISFDYIENEKLLIKIDKSIFLTILGNNNKAIVDNITFKKDNKNISFNYVKINSNNINDLRASMNFVLCDQIDLFVGETVRDEIAYGMESLGINKNEMIEFIEKYSKLYKIEHILSKDVTSLGTSDKVKVKIVSALACKPKILVLYEVFGELDAHDKKNVVSLLKDYVNEGNAVINFTSDVNECMYGTEVLVFNGNNVVLEGKTLSVLNEDKILKKLGYGLPFIIEINRYLMDYGLINKYELNIDKLVNELWK